MHGCLTGRHVRLTSSIQVDGVRADGLRQIAISHLQEAVAIHVMNLQWMSMISAARHISVFSLTLNHQLCKTPLFSMPQSIEQHNHSFQF